MDMSSPQIAVGTPAHCIDGHVLCWPGAYLPQLVPVECLTPTQRAQVLTASTEVPVAARVQAELDAGNVERAWQQLSRVTDPLSVPPGLEATLMLWNARTLADLGLPARHGPIQVIADPTSTPEARDAIARTASEGLQAVYKLLDPWPWPRWIGPVLIISDGRVLDGLPAQSQQLTRPALPMIRIHPDTSRQEIARRLCRLALALSAPPSGGWPPWFTTGMDELAAAKAESLLVSPHRMLLVRQAAGMTGLTDVMTTPRPDPPLSEALVSYLLHPSRSANLASFLDLLRNGATSAGALQLAYGLSLQQLLDEH